MPQNLFQLIKFQSVMDLVCRKRMPQGMHARLFPDPRFLIVLFDPVPDGPRIHRRAVPGQKHVLIACAVVPDGKVDLQRLTGLADQRHHPILPPFPLPDGQLLGGEIDILELQVHQLAHPQACLQEEHDDGEIPGVLPGDLQQRLVLGLEEDRRLPLLPDRALDRVGRVAVDDLVVLEEFEEAPDRCQLPFPGLRRRFLRCQDN